MHTHTRQFYSLIVAATMVGMDCAYAQQPPDSVASDTLGNTAMGYNAMVVNSGGAYNTSAGYDSMSFNTIGSMNVAFGYGTLNFNVSGNRNAALGDDSLHFNQTGAFNTGVGTASLYSNTTGGANTGLGDSALYTNLTGSNNTAVGAVALTSNTTGIQNSAVGSGALASNTTGNNNMGFGEDALYWNTTGNYNTGVGTYALTNNTTASGNNAQGYAALYNNTTGAYNAAQGYFALSNLLTGNYNVGIGYQAGNNQTTGNNDIYISNAGIAAESGIIRIGSSPTQTAAFVAGISGRNVMGVNVMVNSAGQLGVASSSRRYKEDIQPLGESSGRLYGLRPVQFRYIQPDEHGQKPVQYGLIAEEVAATLPELVVYNDKGQPETVRYQELTPMLVNEVQQLHEQIAAQALQLAEVSDLKQQLTELKELVATLRSQAKNERVAMR